MNKDKTIDIVASVLKKDVSFIRENLETEFLWNSLMKIEIIMTIEEEYDIVFESDDIKRINTVQSLIDIVGEKV